MKKFITLICAIAFLQVNAQVVLRESFDDNPLPSGTGQDYPIGWTPLTKISGGSLWRIKTSFPDGSTVIKPIDRKYLVGFEATSGRTYNEWLISKEVTLLNTTRTNIVSFYSYHVSDGTHSVRISDDGGTNWVTIWTDTNTLPQPYPDENLDSTTLDVAIPDSYKGKNVKVAWVFESPTCTNPWAFDFISIQAVISGVDIEALNFVSPMPQTDSSDLYVINKNIPVTIKVRNNGRTDASNVPVSYILNGGTPVNGIIPLVKSKETVLYTFDTQINISEQSVNTLKFITAASGDELSDNNESETISFWVGDDSNFVVFDFDDPSLVDSVYWATSDYKMYKQDAATMAQSLNYESLFGDFVWKVGVGGATLFPKVWGIFAVFSYSRFNEGLSIAADRWLVLPQCHINNSSYPVYLQWNAASCFQQSYPATQYESYEILISDKSNQIADFTKLHEVLSEKFLAPNEPVYPYNRSIDISAYKGKDVYVAFRLTTNSQASRGMFILDNIKILGSAYVIVDSSSIEDIKTDDAIKIYPNPANDQITITSDNLIQKVEIYNMMGQRVYSAETNEASLSLNVSLYKNGLYTVKAITQKGEIIRKINIVK